MAGDRSDLVLLVDADAELPAGERVWGTGGWLPPERREALDWLTLARLLGWGVTVAGRPPAPDPGGARWVIVAGDPDRLGEEAVGRVAARLAAEPVLVVARAAAAGAAWARLAGAARGPVAVSGRSLDWSGPGPGRQWHCRNPLDGHAPSLDAGAEPWATLDGAPLITARRVGRGVVATLGFDPSRARDQDGSATALLTHLLTRGAPGPVAWFDWEGCLVLRMDDPGSAQSVYCRSWTYPKIGEAAWADLGADLGRRGGRLSIGYVVGWVDDGDAARGELRLAGRAVPRVPGQVVPSRLVRYRDRAGHAPGTVHDYESEYRGIQALRAAGLADVELHGYTHVHPDAAAWAAAPDRYEAVSWFRELGRPAAAALAERPAAEHPLALGVAALARDFGVRPTTLICPGDEWTSATLERALDLGLELVSSYYLAVRDGGRFCWATHVCAPYLNLPAASWFDAGVPVVGYFHDSEPAVEGVGWVGRWLDGWQAAGARRLLDFRELAAAVSRRVVLAERAGGLRLTVAGTTDLPLVRPLIVRLRVPGELPARVSAEVDGVTTELPVEGAGGGCGRVTVPRPPAGG